MVYQKKQPVSKFVLNTVVRVKVTKSRALLYAVKIGEQDALIQEASMFVDRVMDLGKTYSPR